MQVKAYRRRSYVIAAVLIDLLLWIELRRHEWIGAGAFLFVMLDLTARRMSEIGWERMWVVPYCCVTLSPLSMLVFWPSLNPWVAFSCVAALHIPVSVWPSSNRQTRQASED